MQLRIGTRKSKLALIQTQMVIELIEKHFPKIKCTIVPITTSGDLITDKPLYDIGGKALFLKELEQALIEQKIDLAVHSLKDVPGILPQGLKIAAVLQREDARDVLVSKFAKSIKGLPINAKVGTSSVRRKVQLQKVRPDLEIVTFRGNVPSRIEKLFNGEVDATILASAGLKRLSLFDPNYCSYISTEQMLPAAGQGVIAIEISKNNKELNDICEQINHLETWDIVQAERAFLTYLDASCRTPIAAYSRCYNDKFTVDFMLADFNGSNIIYQQEIGTNSYEIGIKAAKEMLEKFGGKLP